MSLFSRSKIDAKQFSLKVQGGKLQVTYQLTDEKQIILATGRITRYGPGALSPKWSLQGTDNSILTLQADGTITLTVKDLEDMFNQMVT